MSKQPDDRLSPPGAIWVCGACGKTALDRYGIEGSHSPGWDESCMLHAVLAAEGSLVLGPDGLVTTCETFEPSTLLVAADRAEKEGR